MMILSLNIVIYVLITDVTNALILDVAEREYVCAGCPPSMLADQV